MFVSVHILEDCFFFFLFFNNISSLVMSSFCFYIILCRCFTSLHCFLCSLDHFMRSLCFSLHSRDLCLHVKFILEIHFKWHTSHPNVNKYIVPKCGLCSSSGTKADLITFFPYQPRTSSLLVVKFKLKIVLFWNISLFYRINAFIVFVQIKVFKLYISISSWIVDYRCVSIIWIFFSPFFNIDLALFELFALVNLHTYPAFD